MKTNTIKMAAILLASTALVAGCGKKKVEALPPVAEGTEYAQIGRASCRERVYVLV